MSSLPPPHPPKNALYSQGLKLTLVLTEKAVQVRAHTHNEVIRNHNRKRKKTTTRKCMCLCSTFTREGLGSAEQGLVLHGVLFQSWHVRLRKGDVNTLSYTGCLQSASPPTSSEPLRQLTTTKELQVRLNNLITTDPVGPRPVLLHIAPV